MSGKYNLEKIKADALLHASLDEVKNGDDIKKLRGALDRFPTKKMIDAVNYLDKNILPAVKKRSGDQSPDFIFFKELVDLVLWCIVLRDRFQYLEQRWVNEKINTALLREMLAKAEEELNKYCTLEDLWLTEGLEHYLKGVQSRAETLLNRKKS